MFKIDSRTIITAIGAATRSGAGSLIQIGDDHVY